MKSLGSHSLYGIALHGDEWELILGIKCYFHGAAVAEGTLLAAVGNAHSWQADPLLPPRTLSAQPQDSLRTPKLFAGRSCGSTGDCSWVAGKAEAPSTAVPGAAAFPWPVNHGV